MLTTAVIGTGWKVALICMTAYRQHLERQLSPHIESERKLRRVCK